MLIQEQSASISPLSQGQVFCVLSAHVRDTDSVGLSLFSCQDTFCKEFWKILVVGTRFMQHATFYETTADTLRGALEHSSSGGSSASGCVCRGAKCEKNNEKYHYNRAHTSMMVILVCISRLHCSS